MTDFSLSIYKKLLYAFLDKAYTFQTFEEFIESQKNKAVVLRHDVEKLPKNSLKTARIEHELGIKGTYYFRAVQESYHLKIIQKIVDLGH